MRTAPAPAKVVRVRVPGSTSNLGPGFDCLGLALNVFCDLELSRRLKSGPFEVVSNSPAADRLLNEAALAFFSQCGLEAAGVYELALDSSIPSSRGLGSSASLRVGVIAALNRMHAGPLDRLKIAALATSLEGHPDNAAAAVFGGFCISRTAPVSGALVAVHSFPVSQSLSFVTASPDLEILTSTSRERLGRTLPFMAAVRNINSVASLVAIFASGRYPALGDALEDHLHQPARLPGIPGASDAIAAGVAAGALTGFLSGSGSSVICIANRARAVGRIGQAMSQSFASQGHPAAIRVLHAVNRGFSFPAGRRKGSPSARGSGRRCLSTTRV